MFWILGTHRNRVRTNQPCCIAARQRGQRNPTGIPGSAITSPTTVHPNPSSLESSYLGHG